VWLLSICDEELRLVGVWTRVCHSKDATGIELLRGWIMSIDARDTKEANYEITPTGAENGCGTDSNLPLRWIEFHLEKVYPRLIGHLFRYRLGRQLGS